VKALSEIETIELGMTRSPLSDEQYWKALAPIDVNPVPKTNDISAVLLKASSPMLNSEFGVDSF
jgi:hypothetical protein